MRDGDGDGEEGGQITSLLEAFLMSRSLVVVIWYVLDIIDYEYKL